MNEKKKILIIFGIVGIIIVFGIIIFGIVSESNSTINESNNIQEVQTEKFSFQVPANFKLIHSNYTIASDGHSHSSDEFIFLLANGNNLTIGVTLFDIYDKTMMEFTGIDNTIGQTPKKINGVDGFYEYTNNFHIFSFGSSGSTVFFRTNDSDYENVFNQIIMS